MSLYNIIIQGRCYAPLNVGTVLYSYQGDATTVRHCIILLRITTSYLVAQVLSQSLVPSVGLERR